MVLPIKVPGHSGGEATLDRLVQEALTNCRSACEGVQRVDPRMERNHVLLCLLQGDSRGFNSSQVRASHGRKGLRLIAIEER
jgi:signal transduction histidine kinase